MRALIQRLMADKAKASLMLGLVAVLLLMWGRLMLKQVPRTAVADPAATVAATAEEPKPTLATGKWAAPVVRVDLPAAFTRDLFSIETSRYPRNENAEKPVEAKLVPEQSDELLESAVVQKAAAGLTLQTTMLGEKPRAMINGQILELGQNLRGFTLKSVSARNVVLEMNGVEIQLGM